MKSLLNTWQVKTLFAAGLVLLAPVAVMAQDAATFPASTLVLTDADGAESTYQVTDVSVYSSYSAAYDDVPATTVLSVSLTNISPIDAALLEWAAQTTDEDKVRRDIKVTTTAAGADGETELSYEITDGFVSSFSATNSTYAQPSVSLTIEAAKLTIDGVTMN